MPKYIDADAFIGWARTRYCKDCDRRKGMKNGKMRFIHDIGSAPCRACNVDDMVDDVDNFPAAEKWISVKERLPEVGGEYLAGWYGSDEVVLVRFTNDCFGMRFGLRNPEKEHRPTFYYLDDEWGEVEQNDIECWMQKPVPPKVEG